ncbi:MAG TPA: transcriptional regulator [Methanotrichaceae archaeon]|nr:MAG: hypothetical protein A4E47_00714 [Methanosaeta sp. PtaU1.Bin028]HOT07195.1 transcriptional regulator [Methanotrichaceae archaeon]HQF17200.1 transcriptional regulator [Methanotrichaceae archaeon]HQI91773.1 transcriptional regulator [Methanotrichaceae archaeon]HQJ29026.1 transcriptional regulator [Methanotrichaceae archaeon]
MRSPCEEIVWEVLPGIRAAIALELVRRGLSQRDASRVLGITPAAVSQYVSRKRGYSIEFREDVRASIEQLAEELVAEVPVDLQSRICQICQSARGSGSCSTKVSECTVQSSTPP